MNQTFTNWEQIENKLKNTLDPERYRHTLGVSYTAAALAMAHGLNVQKARLAGLLHDCAKYIPSTERIELCFHHGIEVSDIEKKNTSLLHSKLGVYIAKTDFQITDEEILGAIRWHTTGHQGMSPLEQIVYIADYIEPNRDDEIDIDTEIRSCAYTDLDKCCMMILERSVEYIRSSDKDMDEMTVEAYYYYKKKGNANL